MPVYGNTTMQFAEEARSPAVLKHTSKLDRSEADCDVLPPAADLVARIAKSPKTAWQYRWLAG